MRAVPDSPSQARRRGEAPGELAIVLHTHMPYVEGFGTWPFGEEWLWEAIATSYLPLLEVLDGAADRAGGRVPLTLSLTPVLCDQLEAPGAMDRCLEFLRTVRPQSHRLDIEQLSGRGDSAAVGELERSAAEYARAAQRLAELQNGGDGLLRALGAHAGWTSSATHAILPLLILEEAADLQIATGIESHRRRFGSWDGGFWLPECAYAPWLAERLQEAGVRRACVELTEHFGLGSPEHLRPRRTEAGPVLWPVDRAVIELVWGRHGYPASSGYRAYDRLTERHHRLWRTDGRPYDHEGASDLARRHAREFVTAVKQRVAGGGTCVCALDTELLGHWWYEGPQWLSAVLEEAERQKLRLVRLDETNEWQATEMPHLDGGSWGEGGDLRTWSGPPVADLAWQARAAELTLFRARHEGPVSRRAMRELMALQSSDWAFLAYRSWAGDYPRRRASAHLAALGEAFDDPSLEPGLRNLAPYL